MKTLTKITLAAALTLALATPAFSAAMPRGDDAPRMDAAAPAATAPASPAPRPVASGPTPEAVINDLGMAWMREAATVLFFNAYCAPWPNPNAYEMDTILTDPVWEFAVIKNRGSVLAYFDVLSDRIARGNRGICEEVRGEYERVMNRIRWIISYDVTQRPHVFRQYGR